MSALGYKTRGQSSPQGKAKVYFCCHPLDQRQYLDSISQEILSRQNCAVWYPLDPNAIRDREYLEDLKQMRLFVVPVTTRLLLTKNPALNTEVPFALQHHIPILPLMQESGLAELFNQKCGDFQFLDPNAHDVTAISYEEKLDKYLSDVLIGDDLTEKIRAAFDAYVFLSYRKKDRKYAQELMRLIHKHDVCRDIAIWYDEFLTPGENFNDAIKAAFEKSALFVLTVTPSILEKTVDAAGIEHDNYIQQVEYPMAIREEKPILPVQLLPTDPGELKQKYPALPKCADARNADEFSRELLASVKALALQEQNSGAEHLFFIGLAYLAGVDVELDSGRGIALIQDAANQGLPEAMQKMVSVYRMGEGVPKDLTQAILWQKRFVEAMETRFREDGTSEAAGKWLDAQMTLGELYHLVGVYDKAAETFKELSLNCKKMYKPTVFTWQGRALRKHTAKYPYAFYLRGLSCLARGEALRASGNTIDAFDAYDDAEDLLWEYTDEVDASAEIQFRRASAYIGLGDVALEENSSRSALKDYQSALELLQKYADPNAALLAECYEKIADALMRQESFEEARAYCRSALTIRLCRAEEDRTEASNLALAGVYLRLGDLLCLQSAWQDAVQRYEQAEPLLQTNEEFLSIERQMLLVKYHMGNGTVWERTNQFLKAQPHYEAALKYLTGLPETEVRNQSLKKCHHALERIFRSLGDHNHAQKHNQAALSLSGEDAEKLKTLYWNFAVRYAFSLRNATDATPGFPARLPPIPRGLEQKKPDLSRVKLLAQWLQEAMELCRQHIQMLQKPWEQEYLWQNLEFLGDYLYELAHCCTGEMALICLQLSCEAFEILYRCYPYRSEYGEKHDLLLKTLSRFDEL